METRKKRWVLGIQAAGCGVLVLMGRLIGSFGMAYLGVALEICLLPETLLFLCLPVYVEKMIRSRIQKSQYKNADMVWKAALFYAVFTGLVGGLFFYFCAGAICGRLFGMEEAEMVLQVLAPVFLLDGLCAVFQGYFQGNGTAMPTVVSSVLRQLMNLSFGVLFGNILEQYGTKAAALLHHENFAFMYGATGVAAGFLLAAVLEFLFLLLIYLGGRRKLRGTKEGMRLSEDGTEVLVQLARMALPMGACYACLRICVLAGFALFAKRSGGTALPVLGGYYTQILLPAGIVCIFGLCLGAGAEGNVIRAYRAEEWKNLKNVLNGGMQGIWMFSLFFSMAGFVLSPYLTKGNEEAETIVSGIRQGAFFPVLLTMGIYFAHILWELERKKTVLLSFAAALAGAVCTLIIGGRLAAGNPILLVYGWNVFAFLLCLADGVVLLKLTRSDPEWIRQYLMPFFAAAITGLCVFLLCRALCDILGAVLTVGIGILVGCFCYGILLLVFQCIRERELYFLPGGKLFHKIGNFLHLLQ